MFSLNAERTEIAENHRESCVLDAITVSPPLGSPNKSVEVTATGHRVYQAPSQFLAQRNFPS
jgi:hypothetical protein